MINEKQDIAFILSFLPTVDFIKERGKDCDVLSVTYIFRKKPRKPQNKARQARQDGEPVSIINDNLRFGSI